MAKVSFKSAVDQYAELSLAAAAIKKQLEQLRPIVISRGDGVFAGKAHTIAVGISNRQSLDMAAVKGHLTPAEIAECSRVAEVITVRVEK